MRSQASSVVQRTQEKVADTKERMKENKNKKEVPKEPNLSELLKSASQPQSRTQSVSYTEVEQLRPNTSELAKQRKMLEKKLRDYNQLLQSAEIHDAEHELQRQNRIKRRNKEKKKKKENAQKRAKERAEKRLQNTVLFDPAKHVGVRNLVFKEEKKKPKKNIWFNEEDDSDIDLEDM